ncbi:DNA polymerase alpha/epsilon subunit B-domain-containing protein [Tribonema minus]|uniref:DNA polymerase epsilon subunit n=1 Tax=Tribonema minus TaxID=303371 RepID=A0A835YQA3_9STRA|nr:DNA polymerase alpha/epsilon subunit B-domain-containing protein [Tribonema minus]
MGLMRQIAQAFRLQGLQLTGEAMKAIISVIESEEDSAAALGAVISAIKDKIERKELRSTVIDEAAVAAVAIDLSNTEDDLARASLKVLNAFEGARLWYDPLRKSLQWETQEQRTSVLHAGPEAKGEMLRDRLLLMQQRTQRHELFRAPVIASSRKDTIKLTSLDSLLGSHGGKCIMGMLTQPSEGAYHIEDLTCQVPIDVSGAGYTAGMFTENCVVVAEGEMVDGAFRIDMMGFPPPELRKATALAIGQPDLFGTGMTHQQVELLDNLEGDAEESMFILLSDVHLDKPAVMEKLRVIFEGFSDMPEPPLFVLMGDFSSAPINQTSESVAQMADKFDALGSLIAEFPALAQHANFVIVPGPNDPATIGGMALPRGPIPRYFAKGLVERVSNVHLATSPCRLRFYTQEIVLFRDDIFKKMQRHCIVPPKNPPDAPNMDASEHLVKTLLDQGHLCPLPLSSRPIHCQFDAALRLYPLPQVVILADRSEQFSWQYHDSTWAINPGSFPSDFSFVVYRPSSGDVEFSSC